MGVEGGRRVFVLCSSLSVMTGRRDNGLLARRGRHTDTPSIAKHPCAGGGRPEGERGRGGMGKGQCMICDLALNYQNVLWRLKILKCFDWNSLNQGKKHQQVLDQVLERGDLGILCLPTSV